MLGRGRTPDRGQRPAWRAARGLAVAPPSRLSLARDRLVRTIEEREPWEFEPLDAMRARMAWRRVRPIGLAAPLGSPGPAAHHALVRATVGLCAVVMLVAGVVARPGSAAVPDRPAMSPRIAAMAAGSRLSADEPAFTAPDAAFEDVESGLTPMAAIPASAVQRGTGVEDAGVSATSSVTSDSRVLNHYETSTSESIGAIASRFNVSVATVRQANGLSPMAASVPKGRALVIPKVDGVLVKVDANDTLATIAKATGVSAERIYRYNGLESRKVTPGQVLVVPGGRDPKRPDLVPRTDGQVRAIEVSTKYSGKMINPVASGHLTQGYHYGHWAIDIGAAYGEPVVAAARGTVIFSGWRNNGGGYQVWIAHGSDIFTTYNHMSAVTVAIGEEVRQGDQVGKIGATGFATGPHCHFETWMGMPGQGGKRVNPFGFL